MIGASDLNRLPRWATSRYSEGLSRYVQSELGGERLALPSPSPGPYEIHGLRARFAARLGLSRAIPAEAPKPIRMGVGAVHFAGETEDHRPRPHPSVVFASPTLALSASSKEAQPEELCSCEF